jgi:hypothetical protein
MQRLSAKSFHVGRLMEERGFVRKQARVNGVSGKAWTGIRLKEHDELMQELARKDGPELQSLEEETDWLHVKRFPLAGHYKSVFNGGVKVA